MEHFPESTGDEEEAHQSKPIQSFDVEKASNESSSLKEINPMGNLYPEPYDPYNPNHKPPILEVDEDMEQEYESEYDSKHNKNAEDRDHHDDLDLDHDDDGQDLLPSGSDHILQPGSDHLPTFLLEPKNSFVMKNKPATLQCRAANALKV